MTSPSAENTLAGDGAHLVSNALASDTVHAASDSVVHGHSHPACQHPHQLLAGDTAGNNSDTAASAGDTDHTTEFTSPACLAPSLVVIRELLRRAQDHSALRCPAEYFRTRSPAASDAWAANAQAAKERGVELNFLPSTGVVQARSVSDVERRMCVEDTKYYTLAETIQFVFERGGSLSFAFQDVGEDMQEGA